MKFLKRVAHAAMLPIAIASAVLTIFKALLFMIPERYWETLRQKKRVSLVLSAVLSALASFALLVFLLLRFPERMVQWEISGQKKEDLLKPEQYARLVDDHRKTLAQILLGLGATITVYLSWQRSRVEQKTLLVTQKNLLVAEQNLDTTRFAKAVEQLGSERIAIRFGGIYALEKIARVSPNDHWTVMEILTAYVREHASWKNPEEAPVAAAEIKKEPPPAKDTQAILTVIMRRDWERDADQNRRLDLSKTDLRNANLSGAHLEKIDLSGAHLEEANLYAAHLEEANLSGAHLQGARLYAAHLQGVNLSEAHLEKMNLSGAHLTGANFSGAYLCETNLGGAHLESANLTGAHLQGANLLAAILPNANFTEANLSGALLRRLDLDRVNFNKTHLKEADLRRADLEGARNLTREQLSHAILDHETKLPPEFQDMLPRSPARKVTTPKPTPASPPPAGDPEDPAVPSLPGTTTAPPPPHSEQA